MQTYHFNPKTGNLLVYDNEEKKVQVLEPVDVTVFKGKEVLVAPRVEKKKKGRPKKERVEGGKLTPEQIQEIKDRKADGESTRTIADDLGISTAVIYKYTRKE